MAITWNNCRNYNKYLICELDYQKPFFRSIYSNLSSNQTHIKSNAFSLTHFKTLLYMTWVCFIWCSTKVLRFGDNFFFLFKMCRVNFWEWWRDFFFPHCVINSDLYMAVFVGSGNCFWVRFWKRQRKEINAREWKENVLLMLQAVLAEVDMQNQGAKASGSGS